jgi:hypothetical protein
MAGMPVRRARRAAAAGIRDWPVAVTGDRASAPLCGLLLRAASRSNGSPPSAPARTQGRAKGYL